MEKDELRVSTSAKEEMPNPGPSTEVSSDVETTPGASTPAEQLVPVGSLNRQKTPETGQGAIADDGIVI